MSCEQCTQGYVLAGEPKGALVDGAYFSAGPAVEPAATSEPAPARAIVLLTDIFGLPLKNCKIVADELAQRVGCDVWVPDLFDGSPPFAADELEPYMPSKPHDKIRLWTYFRFAFLALSRAFRLYAVRGSVVDARATAFVDKIRAEKKYARVGAVGYCFGGAVAVRLGSSTHFDSVVICHPGGISAAEIRAVKVPASWACAEEDMSFKKSLRDEAEAVFAARKDTPAFVPYEFKDYEGTVHGFAARPNMSIPEAVAGYEGALDQTSEWFKKTL